jgi:hypothetical protein
MSDGWSRKKIVIVALACAIALLPGACVLLARRPVLIAYHRRRMTHSLDRVYQVGASGPDQYDYVRAYEESRDRLVELGYFVHRRYTLQHILVPTPESKRFWQLVGKAFPNNPHTTLDYWDEPRPGHLDVWARPDRIPEWDEFVRTHDVPDFAERFGVEREGEGAQSSDGGSPEGGARSGDR